MLLNRGPNGFGYFTPISTGGDIPEGAIAHFSFAQGVYWTDADGDLTAAEVLSDTSSIAAGVGYEGEATTVELIGSALGALSTDMTVVLRGRYITDDPEVGVNSGADIISMADSGDFNSGAGFGAFYEWADDGAGLEGEVMAQANVYDTGQEFISIDAVRIDGIVEPEVRFDSAYTLTATKLAVSTLGGAVVSAPITISFSIGYAELVKSTTLSGGNIHIALESITIYPTQADAALPTLSTPL